MRTLPFVRGARFFRNAQVAVRRRGKLVKAGLGTGTSDLIGWVEVTVTPEMVGTKVAVFAAVELKREEGGVVSKEQAEFLGHLKIAGGIAGIARSVSEFLEIVENGR